MLTTMIVSLSLWARFGPASIPVSRTLIRDDIVAGVAAGVAARIGPCSELADGSGTTPTSGSGSPTKISLPAR